MRYLVETSGQIVKLALPAAFVLADMTAVQFANFFTPMARTSAALFIEEVATPPSVQMVSTFAEDETSPPVSQPGFTVSTDSVSSEIGALSSSTRLDSTVTAPFASGFTSISGVDGSASASLVAVVGSASGNEALMLAMNGICTVSVVERNVFLTF